MWIASGSSEIHERIPLPSLPSLPESVTSASIKSRHSWTAQTWFGLLGCERVVMEARFAAANRVKGPPDQTLLRSSNSDLKLASLLTQDVLPTVFRYFFPSGCLMQIGPKRCSATSAPPCCRLM